MVFHIYVGSYTNEIYTLAFDPAAPSLTLVSALTVGFHPSWLARHPQDASIIFTGLEETDGKIVAVKYDDKGHGTVLGSVSSGGGSPCNLVATDSELLVGNYETATLAAIPLSPEAPHLDESGLASLSFSGTGPDKERQEASHPHQVIVHPDHKELLIPDLGADKTWRLAKDSSGKWTVKGHLQYKAGSGPRHVAFHNDVLYTILELTSEVSAHRFPALPAEPTLLATVPTMSKFPGPPSELGMLAAEILVPSPNATYPTPYLYASNRNDPSPEGDVISIFSLADAGKLEPAAEVRSGLKHLRGMFFGGEDGKYLVAGGVLGGGVKVFLRTDGGRGLEELASLDLKAPTAFLWA
ncbi:lactonase [Phanerochaete sordida]|uniref:Lactonase n=1 Tax=Phanerochaete sordida TaxID=48140 RepID=A0A9P3GNJ9_9APHY|nr:lactonase [Phanerochaete sordida]